MNRFRVNLHPALYLEETDKLPEQPELIHFGIEADELKDNITMKNSVGNFIAYMDEKYSWQNDYLEKKKSFTNRIKNFGTDKITKWNNNLFEGYKRLLDVLTKQDYFKNGNEKEKLNEVRKLYDTKVFNQYKKYVWDANDQTFHGIKDKLFGQTSVNYKCPADEVFCELTGAPTMDSFAYDKEKKGYSFKGIEGVHNRAGSVDNNNLDKWSDKQKRNFLSKDVPENLWGIKNVSGRKKLLSGLGIAKINRPSEQEKKAIRDLLEASTKLNLQPSDTRDKALVLIEIFKNVTTDTTLEGYREILKGQNITIEEKRLKKLPGIGFEFIGSHENNWNIYTSIMTIIQQYKGVDGAISVLYPLVSQAKQDREAEKKGKYAEGKALDKIYDGKIIKELATKLGIEDFTNVTRLANLPKTYFDVNSIGIILANLNNDETSDLGDAVPGGLKAGPQFYEIYNYVGEEKALNNLLEHAKLINNSLELGLQESEFTGEEIKAGNVKLILLLQEIILRPGEDLLTLLSNSKIESNPETELKASGEKIAEIEAGNEDITEQDVESLKKMIVDYAKEQSKDKNGDDQSAEMIQGLLAENAQIQDGCLVCAGNKIPLSDIASIGWGVDSEGQAGIAFTLKKTSELGKNWSVTSNMSAGGFIGLGNIGGGVGASLEFAKRWTNTEGTKHRIGVSAGATATFTGAVILHAGISYYRNKLEGIDEAGEKQMKEMERELIKTLGNVKTNLTTLEKTMNFNDPDVIRVVRGELEVMAKNSGIKKAEEIEKAVNATIRLLTTYNNQDLSQNGVIESIAQGVAEQYGMAWIEAKKSGIKDKTYLAGASLGAFWVVGTPIVGISVGVKFNKHLFEGVDDQNINRYYTSASLQAIDEGKLIELNRQLGLTEGGLQLSEDGEKVIIPVGSLGRDVKVGDDMKGMMVKDKDTGNIMVNKFTTITSDAQFYSTTHKRELQVGDGPNFNQKITDELPEERFTQEENLEAKTYEKINKTKFNTPEGVRKAIEWFKKSDEVGGKLNEYNPTDEEIKQIVSEINSFENFAKKAIIEIKKEDGKFTVEVKQSEEEGIGIDLECGIVDNLELFNEDANKLAEHVYSRASTLKNPKPLNDVKHPKDRPHPKYDEFVGYLTGSGGKQKNLEEAKNTAVKIIENVNKGITKPDAPLDITGFNWPTDNIALEQVLMSIYNVFARSTRVKGASNKEGENRYEFKGTNNKPINMSRIISEREGEITKTIKGKLDGNTAGLYADLIEASKYYREQSKKFEKQQSTAAHLNNAVGFNLGDRYNPENPLLNPEIYTDMVDLDRLEELGKFTREKREKLHKHAIEMFVKNSALFEPIKANLGISGNITIDSGSRKRNADKTISVNVEVGGKTITLTTGMKVGYFTQCVNHTIILDEIAVTYKGVTQKYYNNAETRGSSVKESSIKANYGLEQIDLTVGVSFNAGSEKKQGSEVGNGPTNGIDPNSNENGAF